MILFLKERRKEGRKWKKKGKKKKHTALGKYSWLVPWWPNWPLLPEPNENTLQWNEIR